MAFELIESPDALSGDEKNQLEQMYRYLVRLAQDLNIKLEQIGSNELTDDERKVMNTVLQAAAEEKAPADAAQQEMYKAESLKSLIIKTASFVQTRLQEYKMTLVGESVAEGKFGRYVRNTSLKVDVTPTGIHQDYTFEEVVQGLKNYTVNAKNYIKTGLLRTVGLVPVYGVAIGKDVVTFDNDGNETYNDGNKVAELTADELSFWQSGVKVASYTGSRISFLSGGNEVMYIQNGKIYAAGDLEIGSENIVKIQNWQFEKLGLRHRIASGNDPQNYRVTHIYQTYPSTPADRETQAVLAISDLPDGHNFQMSSYNKPLASMVALDIRTLHYDYGTYLMMLPVVYSGNPVQTTSMIGNSGEEFDYGYFKHLYYADIHQTSSREVKHDIGPMEAEGLRLDRLRPVTFIYNNDPEKRKRYGLIYEDTVDVLPEICTERNGVKAINYMELVPMLLKETQELRARVKALEEKAKED